MNGTRTNAFVRMMVFVAVCSVCQCCPSGTAEAQRVRYAGPDKYEEYFSYDRFFLNQSLLSRMSGDGKLQRDLKDFARYYTAGLYALSGGDLEKAEEDLRKARTTWPEYFGTDFLLALVYEDKGDHYLAARYYRSYLVKLKDYQEGRYRISAPIISGFVSFDVEPYDFAYAMIQGRMSQWGIDINNVSPVYAFPRFLLPFLLVLLLAGVFAAVHYFVIPLLRRRYRVNHPPEGFWVCPKCGTSNPEPSKECEECGRPRDE